MIPDPPYADILDTLVKEFDGHEIGQLFRGLALPFTVTADAMTRAALRKGAAALRQQGETTDQARSGQPQPGSGGADPRVEQGAGSVPYSVHECEHGHLGGCSRDAVSAPTIEARRELEALKAQLVALYPLADAVRLSVYANVVRAIDQRLAELPAPPRSPEEPKK